VAEIENFLLIEEVIREVATNMMKDPNFVFETVKSNVISFFDTQKEKQALEHSLARAERILKNKTDNKTVKIIDDLENELTQFFTTFKIKDIYTEVLSSFQELIDNKNYNEILKIFNNKGLVHNSQVIALCDLSTKNDAYLNYIIGILKLNNEKATRIKQAIIQKITTT